MFEGILGIKKAIFGLDIGFKTLKVVQVRGSGRNAQLLSAAEIEIPENALTKDGIREKEKLAKLILEAASGAKPYRVSARIASSGLPESLVFTKIIDLPKTPLADINQKISSQAKQFFPIPAEETYIDWQVVGMNTQKNMMEIIVVAAPKVLVDQLAQTIKLAGFELMGLESKPISAVRALINPADTGTYLILDIGAKTTGLICYDERIIKLTSTAAVGGIEIQQDFDLAMQELASEIAHLIKYYQNRLVRVKAFDKIILAGGGANIEGVPKTLENMIKIKTEIGLPIMRLKAYDPKFATALGLAMKEI